MISFTTVMASLVVVGLAIFVSQLAQTLDEDLNACGLGEFKDGKCKCVHPYTGTHCEIVDCGFGELVDSQFLVDSITTPLYEGEKKLVPGCRCEAKFWGYNCANCTTKGAECIGFCKDNYYGARCDILCREGTAEDGRAHQDAGGVYNYFVNDDGPTGICQYDGSVRCNDGRAGESCQFECLPCEYGSCNLDDGTCDCFDGYYGDLCDKTCPGRCSGKNGICQEDGTCKCELGFTGPDCSLECCVRDFGTDIGRVHGECNPDGGCSCDAGWSGEECDCNAEITCSGRGVCSNGCVCEPQFQGARCEMCNDTRVGPFCQYDRFQCPSVDVINGEFVAVNSHGDYACKCQAGFVGDHCDQCADSAYPKMGSDMCSFIVPASLCGRGKVKNDFSGSGVMCDCEGQFDPASDCQNCNAKYYGPDCDIYCDVQCPNSGGTCVNYPEPGCQCPPGKTNVNGLCVVCGGDSECVHGECFRGRCQCDPGYYGDDCNTSAPIFQDKVCNGYTPVLTFETATCDTDTDCTDINSENLANRQVAYRAQQYGRDMFCHRLDTPLQLKGESACCVDADANGMCDEDMLMDPLCANGEVVEDICNERVLEGEVNVFEWCLSQQIGCTKNGECVDPDLCQDRCDLGLTPEEWIERWEHDHTESMAKIMNETWKFPIEFPDPYEFRHKYQDAEIEDVCHYGLNFADYDACRDFLIPNARVFNLTHMYTDRWVEMPSFKTCEFTRHVFESNINGTKTVHLGEPVWAGYIEVISDTTISTALGRLGNGTEAYLGNTEAWIDSITFFGKGEGEVVIYNYTTDECAELIRKSAINYRSCEQITFHELDYSWSPFCAWYSRRSTIGGFEQRCFDQSKVCAGCEDYQEGCEGLPLKSEYDAPMPEPCNTYWDEFCEIYLNETAKATGYCAYAECECEGYAVGGDACNLQCPVPQFTGTEAPCGEDLDPPWGKCMPYIGAIAFGFEQGKCNCYNGGSPDAGCALVCQGEQDCSPDVDTPFSFEAFNCSDIADVQSYEIISETTQMCHVLLRDSICNYWRGRCECATPFTAFTKLEEPLYFNQGSYRIALMQGYEIDEYAPFIKYVPAEESLLRLTKADSLCADEFTYPDEPGMVCDDTGIKFKNTDWTSDGEGKRCKDYAIDQCATETLTVYNDSQCTATDFEYGRLEETDELYDADPVQECLNRCKLYEDTRFFTMEGDDCRSCTPACDNVTSPTRRVYEFTSEAITHYDNKIPSDVPCEEDRRYSMEDMTMGECFNLTSYEQATSMSNTDASDVYNNGYLLEGDSYRVFDFGEVKRVYSVELYTLPGIEVKAVLETLEANSLAEAYSSPNWVFRHLVSGTTAVNLETRFLKVRGVFPSGTKIRPYLTNTKYLLSDTKQGCIKDGNEFTYYDFKPNVYTSEPVECSYSYLREGRCDISYTKGLMSVKECADACALDERLAFTMISGECFCAGDDCKDFTLSSDKTYAVHDNDACAYKFRFQGTCLKSVDGQAEDMMGCRDECASLDYPNFMFPCKCVTDCKKGAGEDIYYIQSGYESHDFVQVRSKSCEHYGHKTITNPRVCEDAALVLGLETPTILEVPQSDISGVPVQTVSECSQYCGSQFSHPMVKTLLHVTDMDTRCDENMYRIDEAGECIKHNCNYMTSKAVYSDCAPVDRRNYTIITSGTCATAGFADIMSESECDLAAVDGAHSGNTHDSGRGPCYYANGYTFWNTYEGDYECSEDYPCVCDDVRWQRVSRSYECACGGNFTFPDVAKGCSAGVYNFDDSNTECENCICHKGEYEFVSDYVEIHSYTCEDHGFHTISHMEDCVRALDEMKFDTSTLSAEYFSQVFTTDKPSGCLKDRSSFFNPSTKSVPCEDTPCVCRKRMNSDFVVGGLGVTCESQGYHTLPNVKECQRAVIELKITSLNNIGSGSGCFYKGEDVHTGTGAPDEYSICRVDPYPVSDRYAFKYSGSCMDDMYKVTTSEECLAAATMLASVYRRNPATLFVNHLSSATCGYWNGFVHFGSGDSCSDAYPCICRKNPAPIVLLAGECSSSGLLDLTAQECEAYASEYATYTDGLMPKNRCLYVNGKYVFVPGTNDATCSEQVPCVCKGKSLASFRQECPEGTERKFENKKICYPTDTVIYNADRSLISEAVDSSYIVEEVGDGMCAPDHDLFFHNRKNPYRVTDYKEIPTKEACKEECLSTKGCTGFSFSDRPTFTYTQISSYHDGKDIINANISDAVPEELGNGVLSGRQSAVTCLQRCEDIHNRRDGIEVHEGKIIGYTRYDGNCECRIPTSGTPSLQTSSTADSVQFGYTASATTCVLSTDGCDKPVLLGPGKCKFGIDHADKTFDECEQLCIDDEFCRTFSWKAGTCRVSGRECHYGKLRFYGASSYDLLAADLPPKQTMEHDYVTFNYLDHLGNNDQTNSPVCRGDCDAGECASGLVCYERSANYPPPPGCADSDGLFVRSDYTDYCVDTFYMDGDQIKSKFLDGTDLTSANLLPDAHGGVTCEENGWQTIHDEQECLAAARLLHGDVFSVFRHDGHCGGKDVTQDGDTQENLGLNYDEESCARACFEKDVNSKGVLAKGFIVHDNTGCYCESLPSHPDPECQPISFEWRRYDYTNKVYTISDTSKPSGCFYEKNTVYLNTASGAASSSTSKAICRRGWKRYSLGKTNLPGKRYRLSMVRKNVAPYFMSMPLKSGQEIVMRHTSDRVASLTHGPRIFESSTDNPGWDFWSRTTHCANACAKMSHISYNPWEEKPSWKETNDGVSFGNDGVGQSGFMIADSSGRCYCQESAAQDLSKNNIASYSSSSSYEYFMFEAADVEFVRRRELPMSTSCLASVTGGRSLELHTTYGDKLTPGNYDDMTGRARYCGQECKRRGYLSFKSNKETGHCVCYDYTWDACGDDPFYNSLSNEYVRLDKSPTISVAITEDNFLDICKVNPPIGPNGWEYGCEGSTWSTGSAASTYCGTTSLSEFWNTYSQACCTWSTDKCTTNDLADPSLVATKDMDEQIYEILHPKKYQNLHYGKGRYCGTLGETTQVSGTYLEMTEACYDVCKDANSFVLDNDGNCACQDTVKCDEFSGVSIEEQPWYEYTGEGECDAYTHEHEVELSMDQKVVVVSSSMSSTYDTNMPSSFCFDESENTECHTNSELSWVQANLEPNIYSLTRVIITNRNGYAFRLGKFDIQYTTGTTWQSCGTYYFVEEGREPFPCEVTSDVPITAVRIQKLEVEVLNLHDVSIYTRRSYDDYVEECATACAAYGTKGFLVHKEEGLRYKMVSDKYSSSYAAGESGTNYRTYAGDQATDGLTQYPDGSSFADASTDKIIEECAKSCSTFRSPLGRHARGFFVHPGEPADANGNNEGRYKGRCYCSAKDGETDMTGTGFMGTFDFASSDIGQCYCESNSWHTCKSRVGTAVHRYDLKMKQRNRDDKVFENVKFSSCVSICNEVSCGSISYDNHECIISSNPVDYRRNSFVTSTRTYSVSNHNTYQQFEVLNEVPNKTPVHMGVALPTTAEFKLSSGYQSCDLKYQFITQLSCQELGGEIVTTTDECASALKALGVTLPYKKVEGSFCSGSMTKYHPRLPDTDPLYHVDEVIECYQRCDTILRTIGVTFENGECMYCVYSCDDIETDRSGITTYMFEGPYDVPVVNGEGSDDPPGCYYDKVNKQGIVNSRSFAGYATESKPAVCKVEPEKLTKAQCQEYAKKNDLEFVADDDVPEFESVCHVGNNVQWTSFEKDALCLTKDFTKAVSHEISYEYEKFKEGKCTEEKCEKVSYKWSKRSPGCSFKGYGFRGEILAGQRYELTDEECVDTCVDYMLQGKLGPVNTGVHRMVINKWYSDRSGRFAGYKTCKCIPLKYAAFCDENVDSLGISVYCLRTPVGAESGKSCYGDVNPYYGIIGLPTEYTNLRSLTVTVEVKCNHAQVFKNYKAYERSVVTYQNAVDECFRACVSGSLFHMGGDASTGDMRINGFQVEKGTHSTEIMGTCHCVEIPDTKEACEAGTTYKWLDTATCYNGENMQSGTLEECKAVCDSSDCNGFSQLRTKDRTHCAFSSHGCNTRKHFHLADAYVKEDIETFRITTGSDSLITKSKYSISSENAQGSPVFFPKETFVPQEEREWFTHLDFTKYSVEAECQGEPVFDDECASAQKLFPEFVPQTCLTDFELSGELCFKYEETSGAYCDDFYSMPDMKSTKVSFTGTDGNEDYIVDGSPDPTIEVCETFELVKEFAEHPLTIRNAGGIVLSNIMTQNVTLSQGEYTYYCMTHSNEMTGRLLVSDCSLQPRFKEVEASSAKECAQGCARLYYNKELDQEEFTKATQRTVTTHFASMKDGCKCHLTNAFESCQNSTSLTGASLLSIHTTVANDCVNDEEMICKEKPEPIDDEMYMCMTEAPVEVFNSKENCVTCGGGVPFDVGSVFFNERGTSLTCRYAEEEGVCQSTTEGWSQYKMRIGFNSYRKKGQGYCDGYKDIELDFTNLILSEKIELCATGCKAYTYDGFYVSRDHCFCTSTDCTRQGEGDVFEYLTSEANDISLPELIQKWNTNAPGLRCFKDLAQLDEAPCDWIRALKHFARGGSYRIGDCHDLAPGTDIETQIPCNGHGFASAGVCACDYAENFQLRSSGVGLSFEAPNLRQTPFRGKACEFMCPGYDMFNMESVCSGHGRCETDGRCACDQGWTGYNCHLACEAEATTLTCSGHGTCNQREQPLRVDIVEQLQDLTCSNETLYLSRDRVIRIDDTVYYMYKGVEHMMLDIFQIPSEKIIRFENSTADGYSVSVDGGSASVNPSISTCQTFTIEKQFVGEPLVMRKSTGEIIIYNLNEENSAEYTVEAGVYNFFSSDRPDTHIGRIEVQECNAKITRDVVLDDYYLRGTAVRHPFLTVSEYPYMPCQDRIDIVRETAFHPLISHTTPDVTMECSLMAGYDNDAYTIICGMCNCEESASTGFWGGYDCRTPALGYYGKDARTPCPGLTGDGLPCNGGGTCTWGTIDGLGETSYADAQCFCGDTSLNTTYARAPRNQAGHMMFHVMNFDVPLYQDTLSAVDGNNTECYDGTIPLKFDECTHDWISNGGTETVLSEAAVVSDVRNEVVLDYDGVCSASGLVIEQVKTEEKLLIGNKQEQMLKCAGACFGEYKFAFDGRCPEGGVVVLNSVINTGLSWDDKVEQCAHACRTKSQPITGNWSYSSNPGFSIRQNGECVCDHLTSSCPIISSLEWKRFDFVTPHKYVRQESCVGKEAEVGPPEGDTDQQRLFWCSSMCQGFVFDEEVASGFLYSSSNPSSCVCQLQTSDCTLQNDDRSRYDFVHYAGFSLQYDTSCKCEVDASCTQGIGEGKRFKILGDIAPMPYTLEERESLFNGDFICVKDDVVQCKAGALELTNYNSDCSCRFGFTGQTCETPRMMCIFGGTETDGSSCICQDEFGNINPKTSESGCCTKGLYFDQIRYATFSPLQDFSVIPDNVFYYDALKAVCKPGPFAFNSVGDGEDSVRIHNYAALTTEYRFHSAVCEQATEMPIYKAVFKYQGNIPATAPHMVITKEEVEALGYKYTKNTESYIDKYAEDKCLYRCTHRQGDEPPWRSFHLKKTRVNRVQSFTTGSGSEHWLRTYDNSVEGYYNPGNLNDEVFEEAEIEACRQSCVGTLVSPDPRWHNQNFREDGLVSSIIQVRKNGRCYCIAEKEGNVEVGATHYQTYAILPDISYDCTCKDKPAYVGGHYDRNFVDPVFHKESKVFDIVYPKSKESALQNRHCLEDDIVYKHADVLGEETYDAMTGVGASIVPYTLRVQQKIETENINNFYDCYKHCHDHPQANSFKWGRPKQVPITFAGRIREDQPPSGLDHCWGHCNSDIDCKESLKCVTRSKESTDQVYAWPGCIEPETKDQMWGSGDELDPDVNICYDPSYLEETCTCTVHNETMPDCLNSYTTIGPGFCSNLVFLDGLTQYAQVLEEDNPLYNPDRTKECMDRCLNEYPSAKAFAMDSSQRCACSLNYCTARQGTSSYYSYRVNFCEDVSQEGYLLEEHVQEYTLFGDYKYIVGDTEYDTVPINPYTCGIETVTEQGDIVGKECSCPINEFTRLYEETSYVEKTGECYAFRTVNTADIEACKTACEAEYDCDSYSVQNGECYLAQGCGQDWDLQEFAPFFCYGMSETHTNAGGPKSTTQCAAESDTGFFANTLTSSQTCYKLTVEYLNMDNCTNDDGTAYTTSHFSIAQISSGTTSVSAYRNSYRLIAQGLVRNDFYYGNLNHKSYFVRQEAKYTLPEYEAKRYIKELNKTSVGSYCTIGEATLYSVDTSHDDANDHRCMQKCQEEYSSLDYVVVRGEVVGQTFSCLCSDKEYTREECEARMETGGTQYKIKVGKSKICKCPGFYLDDGLATSCPPGRYSGEDDPCMSSCKFCPVGQFSQTGAIECESCPAGKVQETATSCRECEAGKTSLSGDLECSICQLGQYSKVKGAGACSDCPIGYFDDEVNEGQTCKLCALGNYAGLATKYNCKVCQVGRYSDVTPVSGCKACSSGRYNPSTGSTSVTACLYCPKGKYQNLAGTSACKNCGYGYYSDQTGRTGCKGCTVGKYQNVQGQTSCKFCEKGRYMPYNNQRYCYNCGTGKYQDQVGKTSCKVCDKGKYQNQNMQTSSSACHNCQTGKYQEETGRSACKPCGNLYGNYAWSKSPDRITKEKSCDMYRTSHPSYNDMYYSSLWECRHPTGMTQEDSGYGDRWRRKCWAGGLDDCNQIARSYHEDNSNSWSWYRPSGWSYYFFCIPSEYQQID